MSLKSFADKMQAWLGGNAPAQPAPAQPKPARPPMGYSTKPTVKPVAKPAPTPSAKTTSITMQVKQRGSEINDRLNENVGWLDGSKQTKVHFSPEQVFMPRKVFDILQMLQLDTHPKFPYAEPVDDLVSIVKRHYTLPFEPYDYQATTINALASKSTAGLWYEVGGGKTLTGAIMALYHRIQNPGTIIVLMPPILLSQWERFFKGIPELKSVLVYQGTPAQRKAMELDVDVLLMSMDIFKNDFQRIYDFYLPRNCTLIVDEAVSVKNHQTQNHKCVWAFQNQDLSRMKGHGKPATGSPKPNPEVRQQKALDKDKMAQLRAYLGNKYGN